MFSANIFTAVNVIEHPPKKRRIQLNVVSFMAPDVQGTIAIKLSTRDYTSVQTFELELAKEQEKFIALTINFAELRDNVVLAAEFKGTITAETRQLLFPINDLNGMTFMILPTKNLRPWSFIGIVPKDGVENDIVIVPGYDAKCTWLIPTIAFNI